MGPFDFLKDPKFRSDVRGGLGDVLQGASNSVAGAVSAPVDGLAWLLRQAGVNTGTPTGGSDWMAQKGLTAEPENKLAGLIGEGLGNALPFAIGAKAPQIARGLLQMEANAMGASTMNKQAGMIKTPFGRIPENGSDTRKLADLLEKEGIKSGYSVGRSGSAISPSQYVTYSNGLDGELAKDFQVRISNHADKYPELATGVRTSVDPSTEVTFEQAANWLERNGFPTSLSKKYSHIPTYAENAAAEQALRETPQARLTAFQLAWLNKPKATRGPSPTLEDIARLTAFQEAWLNTPKATKGPYPTLENIAKLYP